MHLDRGMAAAQGGGRGPAGVRATLNDQRLEAAAAVLLEAGVERVLDIGCGNGKLIERLLTEPSIRHVMGIDESAPALALAADRLGLTPMGPGCYQGERALLMRRALSSIRERGTQAGSVDAAVALEVIEHVGLDRLPLFEQVLFGRLDLPLIMVSTPNREYNVHLDLGLRRFRHHGHHFEWTRDEFGQWVETMAERYGYTATRVGIGEDHPDTGPQTQAAVFRHPR